jgi:8-oxo-dGTP pyrophosphatase MutT (NUDIX family)
VVPVFRGPDGLLRLVLIRRTEGGVHGGQLAFPGGKRDADDESPLATALREAEEELGLGRDRLEVLAALPVVETLTTQFRISPFLARVERPQRWRHEPREVSEVLEIAVEELMRPEAHGEEVKQFPTWPGPRAVPFYRVGARQIWGATYRILRPLLPRLAAGEWRV